MADGHFYITDVVGNRDGKKGVARISRQYTILNGPVTRSLSPMLRGTTCQTLKLSD